MVQENCFSSVNTLATRHNQLVSIFYLVSKTKHNFDGSGEGNDHYLLSIYRTS